MPHSRNIYTQLSQEHSDESSEKLLGGESVNLETSALPNTRRYARFSFWIPHIALCSLYTILYIALYVFFIGSQSHKLDRQCLRQTSLYCEASPFQNCTDGGYYD